MRDFSFSSSWRVMRESLSEVTSSSVSSCLALLTSSRTSSSAFSALSFAALLASSLASHLDTTTANYTLIKIKIKFSSFFWRNQRSQNLAKYYFV
jgi:hypothetical protein